MMDDISMTGSDKRWWDYRELFNSREVRYRTLLVLCMGFFGQVSDTYTILGFIPSGDPSSLR